MPTIPISPCSDTQVDASPECANAFQNVSGVIDRWLVAIAKNPGDTHQEIWQQYQNIHQLIKLQPDFNKRLNYILDIANNVGVKLTLVQAAFAQCSARITSETGCQSPIDDFGRLVDLRILLEDYIHNCYFLSTYLNLETYHQQLGKNAILLYEQVKTEISAFIIAQKSRFEGLLNQDPLLAYQIDLIATPVKNQAFIDLQHHYKQDPSCHQARATYGKASTPSERAKTLAEDACFNGNNGDAHRYNLQQAVTAGIYGAYLPERGFNLQTAKRFLEDIKLMVAKHISDLQLGDDNFFEHFSFQVPSGATDQGDSVNRPKIVFPIANVHKALLVARKHLGFVIDDVDITFCPTLKGSFLSAKTSKLKQNGEVYIHTGSTIVWPHYPDKPVDEHWFRVLLHELGHLRHQQVNFAKDGLPFRGHNATISPGCEIPSEMSSYVLTMVMQGGKYSEEENKKLLHVLVYYYCAAEFERRINDVMDKGKDFHDVWKEILSEIGLRPCEDAKTWLTFISFFIEYPAYMIQYVVGKDIALKLQPVLSQVMEMEGINAVQDCLNILNGNLYGGNPDDAISAMVELATERLQSSEIQASIKDRIKVALGNDISEPPSTCISSASSGHPPEGEEIEPVVTYYHKGARLRRGLGKDGHPRKQTGVIHRRKPRDPHEYRGNPHLDFEFVRMPKGHGDIQGLCTKLGEILRTRIHHCISTRAGAMVISNEIKSLKLAISQGRFEKYRPLDGLDPDHELTFDMRVYTREEYQPLLRIMDNILKQNNLVCIENKDSLDIMRCSDQKIIFRIMLAKKSIPNRVNNKSDDSSGRGCEGKKRDKQQGNVGLLPITSARYKSETSRLLACIDEAHAIYHDKNRLVQLAMLIRDKTEEVDLSVKSKIEMILCGKGKLGKRIARAALEDYALMQGLLEAHTANHSQRSAALPRRYAGDTRNAYYRTR